MNFRGAAPETFRYVANNSSSALRGEVLAKHVRTLVSYFPNSAITKEQLPKHVCILAATPNKIQQIQGAASPIQQTWGAAPEFMSLESYSPNPALELLAKSTCFWELLRTSSIFLRKYAPQENMYVGSYSLHSRILQEQLLNNVGPSCKTLLYQAKRNSGQPKIK